MLLSRGSPRSLALLIFGLPTFRCSQSLDPWPGTGTAFGETRIASCASIPNLQPILLHLPSQLLTISHLSSIAVSQSVSQSVSHSVNTALAHLRSFLPCAGHAIDNPQSAQASANVNSHALASHHPRPLPSPAHIHSDTHIAITWPQTTKTGRIDLYTQPTWSKTSTLRQATACCMLSLHAEPDD